MAKKLGETPCPNCGFVEVTDINKFVLFMPKGLSLPFAEVTCEKCNLVYTVRMTWESAYKFDGAGCAVVGFSKARGEKFTENDIEEFVSHFSVYMDEFLTLVDSEGDDEEWSGN